MSGVVSRESEVIFLCRPVTDLYIASAEERIREQSYLFGVADWVADKRGEVIRLS
jgi:hypothetical protein